MNFYVMDALGKIKQGSDVSSIGLVMPSEFSVADSPVTTSGEITVSKTSQNANRVYAGPVSGAAAAPTFRALVMDDLPAMSLPTLLGSAWYPDAPPVSPSSLDDEFDDASFNTTLWSEFDPSTTVTVSETTNGLQLDQADQTSTALGGIYQDLPGGDFTFCTKLSHLNGSAGNGSSGLALYDDATNLSAAIHLFMLQYIPGGMALKIERFHNYAAFDYGYGQLGDALISTTIYLRIRRSGSDYTFDWSTDGLGWTNLVSVELTTAPLHIGPCVVNYYSGADLRARYDFFRYEDSDVGLTGIMPGQRTSLYLA